MLFAAGCDVRGEPGRPLALSTALEEGEGESRVREASRLGEGGLGDAEIGEGGLEIRASVEGQPPGLGRADRLAEDLRDSLGDLLFLVAGRHDRPRRAPTRRRTASSWTPWSRSSGT